MLRVHPGATRGIIGALVICVGILVAYAGVYLAAPLSDFWNNLIINILTVMPALLCAWAATLVCGTYQPNDAPRRVWLYFAIALWFWTLGELAWAIYNMTTVEVPSVSSADFFWVMGNIFFTLAFLQQYTLFNRNARKRGLFIAVGSWVVGIGLSIALMSAVGAEYTLGNFLEFFYFIADLILGMVAIVIIIQFGSAAMSRPWVGFFVIALADILYAYLYELGGFAWTVESGNIISLVEGMIYISAYLIMAFGIVNQYLLLKYGAGSLYMSELTE